MLGQLEKLGYFLYYDDETKLWECQNEDSDIALFDFKDVDKDKVIVRIYLTVFDI